MPHFASNTWPWIALAAIGLFHGLNPAMGWLFAGALGMHRNSRRIVLLSLVPIAIGHAVATAAALTAVLVLGLVVDRAALIGFAAVVLIGWALWHAFYGHRQRVRVGMQTGAAGLMLWSFLMATAHGAGLMLIPVLVPICAFGTPGFIGGDTTTVALAALGLHTAAMLTAITIVSLVVYDWIGVGFLRRGWINLDLVWMVALLACGIALLIDA